MCCSFLQQWGINTVFIPASAHPLKWLQITVLCSDRGLASQRINEPVSSCTIPGVCRLRGRESIDESECFCFADCNCSGAERSERAEKRAFWDCDDGHASLLKALHCLQRWNVSSSEMSSVVVSAARGSGFRIFLTTIPALLSGRWLQLMLWTWSRLWSSNRDMSICAS